MAEKDPGSGPIGMRFGPYVVEDRLGEGATAVVFRARQSGLNRKVALKVLKLIDPASWKRFEREARVMASISHPHIIPLLDSGVDRGDPWIAMPCFERGSVRTRRRYPPRRALAMAREISSGIAALHARGILHRDIKASNVLFDDEDRCVVSDFGLVRESHATMLTRAGAFIGTLNYAAPELLDRQDTTMASDQYSLAVLIHELATGEIPFRADTVGQLMVMVTTRPAPPLPDLEVSWDRDLDAVIQRGLAKDPADRFPSVAALLEALDRISEALEDEEALVEAHREETSRIAALAAASTPRPAAAGRSVASRVPATPAPAAGRPRRPGPRILALAAVALFATAALLIRWRPDETSGRIFASAPSPAPTPDPVPETATRWPVFDPARTLSLIDADLKESLDRLRSGDPALHEALARLDIPFETAARFVAGAVERYARSVHLLLDPPVDRPEPGWLRVEESGRTIVLEPAGRDAVARRSRDVSPPPPATGVTAVELMLHPGRTYTVRWGDQSRTFVTPPRAFGLEKIATTPRSLHYLLRSLGRQLRIRVSQPGTGVWVHPGEGRFEPVSTPSVIRHHRDLSPAAPVLLEIGPDEPEDIRFVLDLFRLPEPGDWERSLRTRLLDPYQACRAGRESIGLLATAGLRTLDASRRPEESRAVETIAYQVGTLFLEYPGARSLFELERILTGRAGTTRMSPSSRAELRQGALLSAGFLGPDRLLRHVRDDLEKAGTARTAYPALEALGIQNDARALARLRELLPWLERDRREIRNWARLWVQMDPVGFRTRLQDHLGPGRPPPEELRSAMIEGVLWLGDPRLAPALRWLRPGRDAPDTVAEAVVLLTLLDPGRSPLETVRE